MFPSWSGAFVGVIVVVDAVDLVGAVSLGKVLINSCRLHMLPRQNRKSVEISRKRHSLKRSKSARSQQYQLLSARSVFFPSISRQEYSETLRISGAARIFRHERRTPANSATLKGPTDLEREEKKHSILAARFGKNHLLFELGEEIRRISAAPAPRHRRPQPTTSTGYNGNLHVTSGSTKIYGNGREIDGGTVDVF